MNNSSSISFEKYMSSCTDADKKLLQRFFEDFSAHCLFRSRDKKLLQEDFEHAILYYVQNGRTLPEALELIDIKYLGGFYARPPLLWFSLDDAAKIYPLSMGHGRMTMYRLSMYLKNPVVPELLQMALNFTIKRFPSFSTTLKKGFFWHYLDTTKRRFLVEPETDLPCQPLKVSRSGSQTFRVLYFGNRISVEIFHVLTDGTGGMAFLKVLVSEYLRLTGVIFTADDSLLDINATPHPEETENAFARVPKADAASGFVDKPAVQMNGNISEWKPCRILHFKMSTGELKAAAAKYNASITAYMLTQMFLAARAATDELHGELSMQLPVNMRQYYPSKTLRNFSMYCGIRLPIYEITDTADMVPKISEQITQKAGKAAMSEMLTATKNLVGMLRYIPLAAKQPAAGLVYGFLGDKIFTSNFSNMGVVRLPQALSSQIESVEVVLGAGITNRVVCTLISINDTASFSMSKITADPSFEEKMYDLLSNDGISVTVEGSELYEY